MEKEKLEKFIRIVPNFPIEGIMFKDISPMLGDREAFTTLVRELAKLVGDADRLALIEARGFAIGSAVAFAANKPFIMVRKKDKLPGKVISKEFTYDYAKTSLSIQIDAVKPGEKVIIIDDVLATGSTALAAKELVERLGGKVIKIVHLIEITRLKARELLKGVEIESLLIY